MALTGGGDEAVGKVDAELEQEEEYTVGSAIFEEDNGNSLRNITAVSVCSWPDGARLMRVMLEAVAEVVAMGKGEGCMLQVGGKKDLVVWWHRGLYRDYMHIC
jgi:hypothetical protein